MPEQRFIEKACDITVKHATLPISAGLVSAIADALSAAATAPAADFAALRADRDAAVKRADAAEAALKLANDTAEKYIRKAALLANRKLDGDA